MPLIVNKNGTSKGALLEQRQNACEAIQKAIEATQEAAPHGRDYLGDEAAFTIERALHKFALANMRSFYDHLIDEMLAIDEQET